MFNDNIDKNLLLQKLLLYIVNVGSVDFMFIPMLSNALVVRYGVMRLPPVFRGCRLVSIEFILLIG